MLRFCFTMCLSVAALLSATYGAQASEIFYRGGYQCQRASSGFVTCRDPRDRRSPGFVVGGQRESGGVFYRGHHQCQRASSGYITCRDPRDRRSPGYIVR